MIGFRAHVMAAVLASVVVAGCKIDVVPSATPTGADLRAEWQQRKAQLLAVSEKAATPEEGQAILGPYMALRDPDALALWDRHELARYRAKAANDQTASLEDRAIIRRGILALAPDDAQAKAELAGIERERAAAARSADALKKLGWEALCAQVRKDSVRPEILAEFLRRGGREMDLGAIQGRRVDFGMPSASVICAWGLPNDINRTMLKGRTDEQWVYERREGESRYVYLENHVVTALQD
jgi:hypothetical protein